MLSLAILYASLVQKRKTFCELKGNTFANSFSGKWGLYNWPSPNNTKPHSHSGNQWGCLGQPSKVQIYSLTQKMLPMSALPYQLHSQCSLLFNFDRWHFCISWMRGRSEDTANLFGVTRPLGIFCTQECLMIQMSYKFHRAVLPALSSHVLDYLSFQEICNRSPSLPSESICY